MGSSSVVELFAGPGGAIQNAVSLRFHSSFNSQINERTNHFDWREFRIVATILGPTPLLAANFVIFGVIIHRLGVQYSRLSAKSCKRAYHHQIVSRLDIVYLLDTIFFLSCVSICDLLLSVYQILGTCFFLGHNFPRSSGCGWRYGSGGIWEWAERSKGMFHA